MRAHRDKIRAALRVIISFQPDRPAMMCFKCQSYLPGSNIFYPHFPVHQFRPNRVVRELLDGGLDYSYITIYRISASFSFGVYDVGVSEPKIPFHRRRCKHRRFEAQNRHSSADGSTVLSSSVHLRSTRQPGILRRSLKSVSGCTPSGVLRLYPYHLIRFIPA